MLREVKCTQRLPRLLAFRVTGTGTAVIDAGNFDATLVDNGTGDYTLTFAQPFARVPIVTVTSVTDDVVASLGTVSASAVQIQTRTVAASPAAADAVFHVIVMGYDSSDQT